MTEIKNDVIEKQYEELKNGIKFRIENNITDDWEQHYHCIDVLCEKHKERIQDIENSICVIENLEAKLSEKEKEISNLKGLVNERDKQIKNLKTNKKRVIEHKNNIKISFAVEQLEKARELLFTAPYEFDSEEWCWFEHQISNQIAELTHQHEDKGE